MSRIGKNPIDIPSGVEVKMNGNVVEVKGPKGSLKTEFNPIINIAIEDNQVIVTRPNDNKDVRALHGLYRTLIANNIEGVLNGYEKKLEIIGTGYRAQKQGKKIKHEPWSLAPHRTRRSGRNRSRSSEQHGNYG